MMWEIKALPQRQGERIEQVFSFHVDWRPFNIVDEIKRKSLFHASSVSCVHWWFSSSFKVNISDSCIACERKEMKDWKFLLLDRHKVRWFAVVTFESADEIKSRPWFFSYVEWNPMLLSFKHALCPEM